MGQVMGHTYNCVVNVTFAFSLDIVQCIVV